MVMKMIEPTTVTEVLDPVQTNATTITITLNPQPNRETNCDNSSSVTTATAETSVSNMSPSSCDSVDSLLNSQIMVKRSLKLELSHNNNEIKSAEVGSPVNEDDLSFKSPTSPGTCKNVYSFFV